MKATGMFLVLVVFGCAVAIADVTVKATLCNKTDKPVEFHLFNHNDILSGAAALSTKVVRPCACVAEQTHTDLWHNFPIARINQLVYRDVGSTTGSTIKVCLDATGKFDGYIDGKVNTCATAKKETTYLPAPELTRAQGDLVILQSHLHAESTKCDHNDWTGGCTEYQVDYTYRDGAECRGGS